MPAPLVAALGSTETALLATASAANSAAGGLGLFNNALGHTVRNIDPGLWVFLERIMLDLQGSIGHVVAPAFEMLGRVVRQVADITITSVPSWSRLWNTIGPILDKFLVITGKLGTVFLLNLDIITRLVEAFGKLADVLGVADFFFDRLTKSLDFLTHVLETAGLMLDDLGRGISDLFSGKLLDNIAKGLYDSKETYWTEAGRKMQERKLETSMGIGGRQASYTDFEAFGRQARISSFQLGRGPRTAEQIAEDQLIELKRIKELGERRQVAEDETNTLLKQFGVQVNAKGPVAIKVLPPENPNK